MRRAVSAAPSLFILLLLACGGVVANSGGVAVDYPADPNDGDGDGFSDAYEFTYIGTAPGLRCEPAEYLPGRVEAWPPDFNRDDAVTGSDLSAVAARIGTMVDWYSQAERRFDVGDEPMGDAAITGSDLSAVAARVGTVC